MVNVKLPKGKYVVAVSGGVDSMSLLDMLRKQKGLELIVAHFNHGIRDDSSQDEKLVTHYAMSYNIRVIRGNAKLGKGASEETARIARYDFLRRCCKENNAQAIVTAHHQDDVVETSLINLVRGTGWRGLAPFAQNSDIIRPLQQVTKDELIGYARRNDVPWRDESTNRDERYLRNYMRLTVVPRLNQKSEAWREELLQLIRKQQELRRTIEVELNSLFTVTESSAHLSRHLLIMLPPEIAYEAVQQALRTVSGNSVPKHLAKAAVLFAKTAASGKVMLFSNHWQTRATARELIVEPR